MNIPPEFVAEREYDTVFPDGTARKVRVGVTKPYRDLDSDDGYYRCDFVICWPDGSFPVRQGIGVDSLGALSTALQHWPIELETMKSVLQGKISFLGGANLS